MLIEVLYVGRLVILDATSPVIVAAALLGGFIINPLWYPWLGVHFLRSVDASNGAAAFDARDKR